MNKISKLSRLPIVAMLVVLLTSCAATNDNTPLPKYNVKLNVDCKENIILSKYNMNVYVDDEFIGLHKHGKKHTYSLTLTEGKHLVSFENIEEKDVKGEAEIEIFENSELECKISCEKYKINVDLTKTQKDKEFEKVENVAEVELQDNDFDKNADYPLVTYEGVKSGEYTYKVVAIDAIIGNVDDSRPDNSRMDFEVWYESKGSYYRYEYKWTVFFNNFSKQFSEQFNGIDDGDKVRFYCYVDEHNYIGGSTLKWIELLEKSTLEDFDIKLEEVKEEETTPTDDYLYDVENYVYIRKIGTKYHREHCHVLKGEGIKVLKTEAIESGLTPCTMCDPLP